jgi:hypothetical protein
MKVITSQILAFTLAIQQDALLANFMPLSNTLSKVQLMDALLQLDKICVVNLKT